MPNDVNHYAVLGLNSTGEDEPDRPYTAEQIRRCYRKLSLAKHPDKNGGTEKAKDEFVRLQQSYEILSDPNKRALFDEEMQRNPHLGSPQTSVFFEDSEEEEKDEEKEYLARPWNEQEEHAFALALKKASGVNVSLLISNANCSNKVLLSLATENPEFAQVLFRSSSLLDRLSTPEQFHLFFILCLHRKIKPDFLWELSEKESLLLDYLNSKSPYYTDYVEHFISACLQHRAKAEAFLEAYPQLVDQLPKQTLLILSEVFYPATRSLITQQGNTLRITELLFILDTHPAQKQDILDLCQANAPKLFQQWEIVFRLENQDQLRPEEIMILGIEAFSILKRTRNINLDPNIDMGSSVKNLMLSLTERLFFLNYFMENLSKDFLETLDSQTAEDLLSEIESTIHSFQHYVEKFSKAGYLKEKVSPQLPFLNNTPLIFGLLDKSESQKMDYLRVILNFLEEGPNKTAYRAFLMTMPVEELLFILEKEPLQKIQFLMHDQVLTSLFTRPGFLAHCERSESLRRKVALIAYHCPTLTKEQLSFYFPPSLVADPLSSQETPCVASSDLSGKRQTSSLVELYESFCFFYSHIPSSSEKKEEPAQAIEASNLEEKEESPQAIEAPSSEEKEESLEGMGALDSDEEKEESLEDMGALDSDKEEESPQAMKAPNSKEKEEALQEKEASTFLLHYRRTGFFLDLFSWKTQNAEIQFQILKGAEPQLGEMDGWSQQQLKHFNALFSQLLNQENTAYSEKLLSLYRRKHASVLLNGVRLGENRQLKDDRYRLLARLINHPDWGDHGLTGHLFSSWEAHLGHEKVMKDRLGSLGDWFGISFDEYWDHLRSLRVKYEAAETPEEKQQIFAQIIERYKQEIQKEYPNCIFNDYLILMEASIVQEKIQKFKNLSRFLEELSQEALSVVYEDDTLLKLLDLLNQSGLDAPTLDYVSQQANSLLMSALVLLIADSPGMDQETSQKVVELTKQSDRRALSFIYLEIAKGFLQKEGKIHGEDLLTLYRNHGEALLPTIEACGLVPQLHNARQLQRKLGAIQRSAQFTSMTITASQHTSALLEELTALIVHALLNEEEAISQSLLELHAKIGATVKEYSIENSTLAAFLAIYPQAIPAEEAKKALVRSLIQALLRGEVFFEGLIQAALKKDRLAKSTRQELADDLLQANLDSADLEKVLGLFGEDLENELLDCYVHKIHGPFPQLRACLKSLLVNKKISWTTLFQLGKKEVGIISVLGTYLTSPAYEKILASNHPPFTLDGGLWTFFPLLDQNILTMEEVNQVYLVFPATHIYEDFVQMYDYLEQAEHFLVRGGNLKRVLQSDYFHFVETRILQAIEDELLRLNRLDVAEGALEKTAVLIRAKEEINQVLIDTCCLSISSGLSPEDTNLLLHNHLKTKINALVENSDLNEHRNSVSKFFSYLLDLLTAPLVWLSLHKGTYREKFFRPQVVQAVIAMSDALEEQSEPLAAAGA